MKSTPHVIQDPADVRCAIKHFAGRYQASRTRGAGGCCSSTVLISARSEHASHCQRKLARLVSRTAGL